MESPTLVTNFPSSMVRDQFRATMKMGLPNKDEDRATFYFPEDKEYTQQTSPSGTPYNKKAKPFIDRTKAPVHDIDLMYAVEYVDRTPAHTAIGEFNNPRAIITMVDVDYERVRGAIRVDLGGNTYSINYVKPIALFDIDVYEIMCQAEDES